MVNRDYNRDSNRDYNRDYNTRDKDEGLIFGSNPKF